MAIASNVSDFASITEEATAIVSVQAFFDAAYYRARYADISSNPQIDPLRHYCSVGWKQGRDPTNWFSTKRYLDSHPEVAAAGVNPFVHYVLVRRDEFRRLRRNAKGMDSPLEYIIDEAMIDQHGILHVTGWIVSFAPLQEIAISFGGRKVGLAEYGLQRSDVGAVYANYPESDRSGFSFIQELDADLSEPLVTVEVTALGGIKRQTAIIPMIAPVIQRRKHRDDKIRYNIDVLTLSDDGMLVIEGWAFSGAGIEEITVDLDDEAVGAAVTGLPRPDVGNTYPLTANARWAGFRISKNLGRRFHGEHTIDLLFRDDVERKATHLSVAVTDRQQSSGVIEFNIDSPRIDGGRVTDPVYGDLPVVGWAVAPSGIDHVEVFLDGESKGNAYFGARRNDIKPLFPAMFEPVTSGFGMSIPQRWDAGTHEVRVAVHDRSGNIRQQGFSFEARASDDAESWRLRRKVKQAEIDLQLAICDALKCRPEFVLLMRLRDGGEQEMRWARQTIASLQDQAYPMWRLLMVRPAGVSVSGLPANIEIIEEADPACFGSALVGLLRAGDDFGADALLEFAVNVALHPEAAIFYCDERRYDYATKTVSAFFKPDWSPDLLLSTNYLGRLWFVRAAAMEEIGFTVSSLQAGEYDLLLHLTDAERTVRHIPKLLCNTHPRPTDSVQQERQALRSALHRRGTPGRVMNGCAPHHYRVRRRVQTQGMVSIIIPTIAAKGLIKGAITSIRERSTYRNFEIICIDGTKEPEWKQWLRENADKIVNAPKKFNWSRCNNMGVAIAGGEFLLFLNDDIEVVDPDWLQALLEHAQQPEVGVVGPLLVYPDGRVQHAGIVLTQNSGKHIFRFAEGSDTGPFGMIQTQRNVIAVTGACMMMSRQSFETLGGFDEAHTVINNDLDYCLRAWDQGLRVVYTPHTRLVHCEESSRAALDDSYDVSRFTTHWHRRFALGDPFSNPSIVPERDGYQPESEPTETLYVGHPVIRASDVKRILVVKLDHIGDFVVSIPAFNRLKERFPAAEITALVAGSSIPLSRRCPSIDRVIEFAFFHKQSGKGRLKITAKALQNLRAQLAPYHFDIAIDLRQQLDTRSILQHTGATWLAGYDSRGTADWLDIVLELVVDNQREPKRTHVAASLLHLVEAVAVACDPTRSIFTGNSQQDARVRLLQRRVPGFDATLCSAPLVCIHPGGGSAIKQWPSEHFATLIDLLAEGEKARAILVGSKDESEIANSVIRHVKSQESVISLVGRTGIADLPDIIRASDLFVGNDSGPKHLAAGLTVPTVGVHSGSVDAVEWGPLGPHAVALRRNMNCSPCYLDNIDDCHRGHACMRGLLPREVYHICQRLLQHEEVTCSTCRHTTSSVGI
jgi:ADP-heptose:LPS heptosyltransferase/GT2 family glycosyltransferase